MSHAFEQLSGRIIEAAIAVHRALGPGLYESTYENALKVALRNRQLAYFVQREVKIYFEGEEVGLHRLDLVVCDAESEIVVELKAVEALEDIHFAQVRAYLKASKLHVGLLINFNAPTLTVKRVVA